MELMQQEYVESRVGLYMSHLARMLGLDYIPDELDELVMSVSQKLQEMMEGRLVPKLRKSIPAPSRGQWSDRLVAYDVKQPLLELVEIVNPNASVKSDPTATPDDIYEYLTDVIAGYGVSSGSTLPLVVAPTKRLPNYPSAQLVSAPNLSNLIQRLRLLAPEVMSNLPVLSRELKVSPKTLEDVFGVLAGRLSGYPR